MSKITEKLLELKVITAEQGDDEDAVVAAIEALHQDNTALAESNAALVTENNRYKIEAERAASAAADTVIQAAIDEGKFSERDKDTVAFYKTQYLANPEQTRKVLASLYPNPILQKQINVRASDSKRLVNSAQSKAQLQHEQQLAVAEVRAANPKLYYQDAFNKARREHPEVFPPEAVEA